MSNRVITALLIVFFVILVGVSLVMSMFDWAWVDVRTHEDQKPIHISMPVPLNAINLAMHFIPDQEWKKEIPVGLLQNNEQIVKALKEIRNSKDTILVKIETQKEKVLIEKRGESLMIHVNSNEADVKLSLPIDYLIKTAEKGF